MLGLDPPPGMAGRAAPAQTPLPARRPGRGRGGLGKWALVPSPPPRKAIFFPPSELKVGGGVGGGGKGGVGGGSTLTGQSSTSTNARCILINAASVAPVGISNPLGLIDLAAQSLINKLQAPVMTAENREQQWPEFAVKFTMSSADIEAITEVLLTDGLKVQYLLHQVDRTNGARIAHKRAKGQQLNYVDEWLYLEKCMGMTGMQALTSAWEALTCPAEKHLTQDRWDVFLTYFRRLRSKLHIITNQQAYDKLTKILPMKSVIALHREESKVAPDQSLLRGSGIGRVYDCQRIHCADDESRLAPRHTTREHTAAVISLNKADGGTFIRKLQGAVIKMDDGRVMTLTTTYEQYRMNMEEVLQFVGNGVSAYNRARVGHHASSNNKSTCDGFAWALHYSRARVYIANVRQWICRANRQCCSVHIVNGCFGIALLLFNAEFVFLRGLRQSPALGALKPVDGLCDREKNSDMNH